MQIKEDILRKHTSKNIKNVFIMLITLKFKRNGQIPFKKLTIQIDRRNRKMQFSYSYNESDKNLKLSCKEYLMPREILWKILKNI